MYKLTPPLCILVFCSFLMLLQLAFPAMIDSTSLKPETKISPCYCILSQQQKVANTVVKDRKKSIVG